MQKINKEIKIILFLLLIISFGLLYFDSSMVCAEVEKGFEGKGTSENPYQISSVEDYYRLASLVSEGKDFDGKVFRQTENLIFNNASIPSIGSCEEGTRFKGVYDGSGYKIGSFILDYEEKNALFHNMDGLLKNIEIESGVIKGRYAAALVCEGTGQIYNCLNEANVEGEESASGIAHSFSGVIFNCANTGNLIAPKTADIIVAGTADIYAGTGLGNVVDSDYSGVNYAPQCISDYSSWEHVAYLMNYNCRLYGSLGYVYATQAVCWESNGGSLSLVPNKKVYFEGEGSSVDPYLISTVEDLFLISELSNLGARFDNVYFKFENDIKIENTAKWKGISTVESCVFAGFIDGDGHSIIGLNNSAFIGELQGCLVDLYFLEVRDSVIVDVIDIGGGVYNCIAYGENVDCFTKDNKGFMENVIVCKEENVLLNDCTLEYVEYQQLLDELNHNLNCIVVQYGVHCNNLHKWMINDEEDIVFGDNYSKAELIDELGKIQGHGTFGQPFLIEDIYDLVVLREDIYAGINYEGQYFKQTENIDLSICYLWKPLADIDSVFSFSGIYDGDGKIITIANAVDDRNSTFIGVFSGQLYNLEVLSKNEEADSAAIYYLNEGTLLNCIVREKEGNSGSIFLSFINDGSIVNSLSFGEKAYLCKKGQGTLDICCGINEVVGEEFQGETNSIFVSENINDLVCLLNDNIIQLRTEYNFESKKINSFKVEDNDICFSGKYIIDLNSELQYFAYQFLNRKEVSFFTIIFILCMIFEVVRIIINRHDIIKKNGFAKTNNMVFELWLITLIIMLAINCVSINKGLTNQLLILILGNFLLFILSMSLIKKCDVNVIYNNIKKWMTRNWILEIGILVLVCISLLRIRDVYPGYDANLYYGEFARAYDSFDFSLFSFLYNNIFWGNVSYGFVIFASIGESFCPGQYIGVYCVNIVLFVIALVCLNSIINKLFWELKYKMANIICIMFALMPYGIATVFYFTPDYYHMLFLIFIVYCFVFNYKILFGFVSFIFIFSKSNACLTFFGFLIVVVLYCILQEKGNAIRRINSLCNKYPIVYWISPIFLFVWTKYVISFSNRIPINESNSFFRDTDYIISKIEQFFVYGFRWSFMLVFSIYVCYILIRAIIKKQTIKFDILNFRMQCWLALTVAVMLQFMLLYKMNLVLCPRYTSYMNLWYIITLAYVVIYKNWKPISKSTICIFLCVVLFVQMFYTIDPSIIYQNETYKLSGRIMYSLMKDKNENLFGDLYVYNYEYYAVDRVVMAALSEIDLSDDCTLYCNSDDCYPMSLRNCERYVTYYNIATKKRCFIPNANTIKLNVLTSDISMIKNAVTNTVYYFEFDRPSKVSKIETAYKDNIVDMRSYSCNNIRINCYQLSF